MYIYIPDCACVYGWLCTLYDGLSWLSEWPWLTMSTPDLVVWVCTQGKFFRCIFTLYYGHNHPLQKNEAIPAVLKTAGIAPKSARIGSKFLSRHFCSRRFKPLGNECGYRVARPVQALSKALGKAYALYQRFWKRWNRYYLYQRFQKRWYMSWIKII